MFELRLVQGNLLKKVIDAIKDLVNEANFDCSSTGFSLQAMDSSHVALVALLLRSEGFEHFRCDRSFSMGMSIANLGKLLKCASPDDIITLKADDGTDSVTFMFESPSQNKISDIEMKLMDIDSDHLGIPEAEYDAIVQMPASEFANICSSLSSIGDTVTISVSKEGVTFSTKGDIGSGNITCRRNTSTDKPEEATIIEMKVPVVLTFAMKYMTTFTKATSLSNQVTISLSLDMPVVVEYKVAEIGHIRYYLAPKIEEEELETNTQPETTARRESRAETEAEPVAEEAEPVAEEAEPAAAEEAVPLTIMDTTEENEAEPETKPGAEEAVPLTIMDTKEENGVEDETVDDSLVKMETDGEADVKPKVEKKPVKAEAVAMEVE
ncbi:hypothetical protein vseg_002445 [Gypsophila vaccaria]